MTETAAPIPTRADFRVFRAMGTRWMDNDVYGHVNNAVYYSYFDTAVNGWLLETTATDIRSLPAIGVVAETSCRYLRSVSFPATLEVGLALERLGRSSVIYRLGLFVPADVMPAAVGRFVHVYVDAASRRAMPVPDLIRDALRTLA